MTNIIHTFMDRRRAAIAEASAAAWEEICGDYDPSWKGDGNYDATMRRESRAAVATGLVMGEVVCLDPAQDLPHIPYRSYWDIEDLPQNAEVIFPKGVWGAEA